MDQIKIGKFIAENRKKQHLTQMQLAEKLNISDRAVSKWENGKSMPDSSIMLELCAILNISANELLSGEVLGVADYSEKMEQNLLDLVREKEAADRRLLTAEILLGVVGMAVLLGLCALAAFVPLEPWLQALLIILGFAVCLPLLVLGLKIEQVAGYYHCEKCGHKYVPRFASVFFAMHMNRTRFMKCPHCGKRSWQKKVLRKD